jgi:hypothetical protein
MNSLLDFDGFTNISPATMAELDKITYMTNDYESILKGLIQDLS